MGSAVCISGLVTFIAAYHYFRIFNSWVEANSYSTDKDGPQLTGVPFNDAYRYMDWLLTVPLLLIEILLVMNLSDAEYSSKAKSLGIGSALMIASGYYGELTITGDLSARWGCWFLSMMFFGGSKAVVAVQLGYTVSDIISKCGVGILIYQISYAKSKKETLLG